MWNSLYPVLCAPKPWLSILDGHWQWDMVLSFAAPTPPGSSFRNLILSGSQSSFLKFPCQLPVQLTLWHQSQSVNIEPSISCQKCYDGAKYLKYTSKQMEWLFCQTFYFFLRKHPFQIVMEDNIYECKVETSIVLFSILSVKVKSAKQNLL